MEIYLIAAIGENRQLGLDGKMCWHYPEDLKFFKEQTMGSPMIMGRKTLDSLPGILPGRPHIVLTRKNKKDDKVDFVSTVDEALKKASEYGPKVFIVGGAEIYKLFLPMAKGIYLTRIPYSGKADTFFPHSTLPLKKVISLDRLKVEYFEKN